MLVEFVTSGRVAPGPALDIGAGTGTNAIWMAERGFDVLGVDVSPLAVERAHAKMEGRALRCRIAVCDFLHAPPSGGPFQFIFDRGCFHVFDGADDRQRFAAHVAAALAPGGYHLMFTHLTKPLEKGQTVTATLAFVRAGPVTVHFPVQAIGAAAPAPMKGMGDMKGMKM